MLSIFKYSTLKKSLVRCMFVSMAQVLRQNEPLCSTVKQVSCSFLYSFADKIFKNVVADQDRN